jgi:hypothetical protein
MSSGRKRFSIGYKIIFPIGVLVIGGLAVMLASNISPGADFEKMGQGFGALLLFSFVAGWCVDSRKAKNRKDQ